MDQEQCSALTPAQPDETARCCMLHDKGFASLIGGLRAAEKAQNAETSATTVQMVSVWFSVVIGVLLTYAGSIGTLSVGGCPDVSGSLECFEHCGLRPETAQLKIIIK